MCSVRYCYSTYCTVQCNVVLYVYVYSIRLRYHVADSHILYSTYSMCSILYSIYVLCARLMLYRANFLKLQSLQAIQKWVEIIKKSQVRKHVFGNSSQKAIESIYMNLESYIPLYKSTFVYLNLIRIG